MHSIGMLSGPTLPSLAKWLEPQTDPSRVLSMIEFAEYIEPTQSPMNLGSAKVAGAGMNTALTMWIQT